MREPITAALLIFILQSQGTGLRFNNWFTEANLVGQLRNLSFATDSRFRFYFIESSSSDEFKKFPNPGVEIIIFFL